LKHKNKNKNKNKHKRVYLCFSDIENNNSTSSLLAERTNIESFCRTAFASQLASSLLLASLEQNQASSVAKLWCPPTKKSLHPSYFSSW